MNTETFLQRVLPSKGLVVIATRPMGQKAPWAHHPFATIAKAAAYQDAVVGVREAFYAVHTFHAVEPGQKFRREAVFAGWCKVIPADLDVDPANPKKYPNKQAALDGLDAFLLNSGWPRPCIVDSGNGFHIYWVLTHEIPTPEWRVLMARVRAVWDDKGLLYDQAVSSDPARVLRAVGTTNDKVDGQHLPVVWVHDGEDESPAVWRARLDRAEAMAPDVDTVAASAVDVAKPSPKRLLDVCQATRALVTSKATNDEPRWYTTLQLANWTSRGRDFAHVLSVGGLDFTEAGFEKKWAHASRPEIKPPTCGTIGGYFPPGEDHPCKGCINEGLFRSSPIVLARKDIRKVELPSTLPPPQPPWYVNSAGVFHQPVTQPGTLPLPRTKILSYVLLPADIIEAEEAKTRDTHWVATVKSGGQTVQRTITIPAGAIGNDEKTATYLNNAGVFTDRGTIKKVCSYMSYYIKQLQEMQAERVMQNTAGWNKTYTKYYTPEGAMSATSIEPVVYAPATEGAFRTILKGGTLAGQIEMLKFFNYPEYMWQQCMIALALAAPLLYKFDQYGLIAVVFGHSGASKSTTMYACGGLHGHPTKYVMNGTKSGSTQNARLQRMTVLGHYPVMLDDVSDVDPADLRSMVMTMTQPNEKTRLKHDITERLGADVVKSSIMMMSSNPSLLQLLAQTSVTGEAASRRCVEFHAEATDVHTMEEADAFKRQMLTHFGHLGPEFLQWCMGHERQVDSMIAKIKADLTREGRMTQQERYQLAAFTLIILGADIAKINGWLDFDIEAIKHFLIHTQLPYMRRRMNDNYLDATMVLQQYLGHIVPSTLVLYPADGKPGARGVAREPHGELRARYEPDIQRVWINTRSFRDYCTQKHKLNDAAVIAELEVKGIATPEKMDLGRGAMGYNIGQNRCLRIDMAHRDMTGAVDLVSEDNVTRLPLKKKLAP